MKLLVFDDEENDELENDIHSFVDKTTHPHDSRFVAML